MIYKVDDRVVLSEEGLIRYALQSQGTIGRVERFSSSTYWIVWETGHHNTYHDEDLDPIPKVAPGAIIITSCRVECQFWQRPICPGADVSKRRRVIRVLQVGECTAVESGKSVV